MSDIAERLRTMKNMDWARRYEWDDELERGASEIERLREAIEIQDKMRLEAMAHNDRLMALLIRDVLPMVTGIRDNLHPDTHGGLAVPVLNTIIRRINAATGAADQPQPATSAPPAPLPPLDALGT